MVGDTVRCPWHHACFSLRTGRPLRPPALRPLDRYSVEQRDGKIYVTGKAASPAPPKARTAGVPESVVIVGGGAAGDSASATLRAEGYRGPITIVDPDEAAPYDRPNCSKDYLAGTAPEDWLPIRSPEYDRDARDHAAIRPPRGGASAQAARGRPRRRQSPALRRAAPGDRRHADPALAGDDRPRRARSTTCARLADSRAIVAAAKALGVSSCSAPASSGSKSRRRLRARGLEVHVVAPDSRPLERVMGPELGDFIREASRGARRRIPSGAKGARGRQERRRAGERRAARGRFRGRRHRRAAQPRSGRGEPGSRSIAVSW